ncbi:MAG TPA: hypothetical protein VI603_13785 [Saprospiraceae bacterium]|nr:hypothetical protein [Saprospiraceae bacterium]
MRLKPEQMEWTTTLYFLLAILFLQCAPKHETTTSTGDASLGEVLEEADRVKADLDKYITVKLTTDAVLTEKEKQMLPFLIQAAQLMDQCFWYEAYGNPNTLLEGLPNDKLKQFAAINYGPWDRLEGNAPFVETYGEKPKGANFYPVDMTKEEFDTTELPGKESLYTFLRRNKEGKLTVIPYRRQFEKEHKEAAQLLKKAATLAEDAGLRRYLQLRGDALLNDKYRTSDMAWLDMKTNRIDIVIGPIETYEDQLFGYKAAHEAYVLVKDMDWSKRLARYAKFLPALQSGLPVPPQYKKEKPGLDTELNAYDVIYYAGDCNAGSKTIAINLPNDEEVQLKKGTRRLQLKNAMRAKFDHILVPITEELIDPSQREHVTFDAFFSNVMFHEVAHGLGIKNTIKGGTTVRKALQELASGLEEGKADILGIYMIRQLHHKGEISGDLMDYYVTFMAGIFRSVRFGASSAHGKANMIAFNFFEEMGAFTRNDDGHYLVDQQKFEQAIEALSTHILTLQGDGDYTGVTALFNEKGNIPPQLQKDLDRLGNKDIPVDIVFEQGLDVLNL